MSEGLWQQVDARIATSLASGALVPIGTETVVLESDGLAIPVRILSALRRKLESDERQRRDVTNPFLPYDRELFVRDISATHLCLLNKFPVLERHSLIVTREFESQTDPLTLADFEALWLCLAERDALAFYNGGRAAGASQSHRHLQLVPLPLGVAGEGLPLESVFGEVVSDGRIGRCPRLPFPHAIASVGAQAALAPEVAARESLDLCRELLAGLVRGPDTAYNLLVTRRFMLAVPRSRPHWKGIPVNALSYAGTLMVRDREQLARVEEIGVLGLLAEVAGGGG